MTQMAEALKKAGVDTVEDRLKKIALKAMIAHASDVDEAVNHIWSEVRKSPFLVQGLLKRNEWQSPVRDLLKRVCKDLGHEIQLFYYGFDPYARPTNKPVSTPLERRAQMVSASWEAEVRAEMKAKLEAEQREKNARLDRQIAAFAATQAAHVKINDKPFWTVTANEAQRWTSRLTRETAFIEMVIEGVPHDGRPIEFYRTPEEIDALWKRSENA